RRHEFALQGGAPLSDADHVGSQIDLCLITGKVRLSSTHSVFVVGNLESARESLPAHQMSNARKVLDKAVCTARVKDTHDVVSVMDDPNESTVIEACQLGVAHRWYRELATNAAGNRPHERLFDWRPRGQATERMA